MRRYTIDENMIEHERDMFGKFIFNYSERSRYKEVSFQENHKIMMMGPMALLPNYFAYFTSYRAILINCLFFPLADLQVQPEFILRNITDVVGFDTVDTYTIRNINEIYNGIRQEIERWEKATTEGANRK